MAVLDQSGLLLKGTRQSNTSSTGSTDVLAWRITYVFCAIRRQASLPARDLKILLMGVLATLFAFDMWVA